jgi:DNA-binding CsgD family transcriptional regulator
LPKKLKFRFEGTYLTEREMEVLRLMTNGYVNKQMAGQLFISIKTVEKHRQQVYRKLRVNCPTAALRVALRSNLIDYFKWLDCRVGENVIRMDSVSGQQIDLPSPDLTRAQ